MFGINEILVKLFNKKSLTEEEKIKILHSKTADKKVVLYLMNRLSQLHINVLGEYEGDLFELMAASKLAGWCWETTESAILFLNDDDYIERGYLKFDDDTQEYYHSWICFKYNGIEYVLDPCLSFLCKKKLYSKIFETKVLGKVSARDVKEELIKQITIPKKENNSDASKSFQEFLECCMGDSWYKKQKENEVTVYASEDVNTPLYRNGAGYKAEIIDGEIKKVLVRYYWNDL